MRGSLSRVYTLTSRNFKEILRDPLSLIFMLAMPLAMEVLFYFLFHEMTDQFAMKYLAPGIVVFAQAFLALFTGLLIALDRSTAFLTRLYVSRAKSAEFIFGYALALIPAVLVQTVLFFVVGGIIDPSIWGIGMLRCLPVALCTALFYIGVGILLGTLCNEKSVGGVASIVIAGQSVLSGMWFPTEGLPSGMVALMKCLPFKNAADCMRSALNGTADPTADFWIPFCIVLAYAAVSFGAAIFIFRKRMRFR
jgi:ABC-2 type transport system permease protein